MPKKKQEPEAAAPKSVLGMAPVQAYVVRYMDNRGKDETRLAFKVGGDFYLLREKINNTLTLQRTSSWLTDALKGYEVPEKALPGGGLEAAE